MKLCIDLDGTIAEKKEWSFADSYKRQEKMLMAIKPRYEVISRINLLYALGHTIIIHSSRHWKDYETTVKWLKKYGVNYHTLILAKPLATYYIDDRNLSIDEFLNIPIMHWLK